MTTDFISAADAPASITITLETPFLYQNRTTGQPSSTPLTTKQLCRILCPASSVANVSGTSIISAQTQLLGFDAATNTYHLAGWRCANTIPILKEACTSWYYESKDEEGGVKGPVSTRELSELVQESKIEKATRVFDSNRNGGEWTSIQNSPHLLLAIEALVESTMPTSWPADSTENGEKVSDHVQSDGEADITKQKEISKELEAFLSSTDHLANHTAQDDENDEEYESDGGTRYVKDFRTGNWIHEALAPKREKKQSTETAQLITTPAAADGTKKRKRNKPKFSKKNAKCWVYVSGLPKDTNEEEVARYFSKCGVIDLDPETQKPKVKLYRHKADEPEGRTVKGDASVCYARAESVELALQVLDENLFRDGAILSVQRAKFEQNTDFDESKAKGGKRVISDAKRKVARLAALQAVGWDEGENGRIAGGLKGLRIIVLMHMFDPVEFADDENDEKLRALEQSLHSECEELGTVEKITIFSKHPAGVIIVKFTQPSAASDAVSRFNGQVRNGRKIEASYWDGVTDYTVRDEEKEAKDNEKRLDEFGDWLENQELPEEFKLRVDKEE